MLSGKAHQSIVTAAAGLRRCWDRAPTKGWNKRRRRGGGAKKNTLVSVSGRAGQDWRRKLATGQESTVCGLYVSATNNLVESELRQDIYEALDAKGQEGVER
jgi:hypothetical protein